MDAHSDILRARVAVPDYVVHRAFVGETIALNLSTGRYYALNQTAAHMLEVLDSVATVGEAVPILVRELGQSAELIANSLGSFCRDLAERRLVELRDGDDGG